MKKVLAVLAAALVAQIGAAGSASADTVELPYGGTATLTIPDVTMASGGSCIHHYGTFSTTTPYEWDVDLDATGPSSWPASDYLYGTGAQNQIVDLLLCPNLDGPGLYTLSGLMEMRDSNYNLRGQVFVSDQFTISRPVVTPPPPPPPAPVPPAPAPLPASDVTGVVTSKGIPNGVKLAFKSNVLQMGTTLGTRLTWTVLLDRKIRKTITQGPGELRSLKVASRDGSGRHVVKILRNGKAVKSFYYRA